MWHKVCWALALAVPFTAGAVGCKDDSEDGFDEGALSAKPSETCDGRLDGAGPRVVRVWRHKSNSDEESATFLQQVEEFNASQGDVRVELELVPEEGYDKHVQKAADSDALPDVLDFDGPFLYNYAYKNQLRPLNACLDLAPDVRDDLLGSIRAQGTYDGGVYGLGTFDSGLGLFARRSVLTKYGIRIPAGVADAYTAEEFTAALERLKAGGEFPAPLDAKWHYGEGGAWYTYGFSPIIQSAGADLVNRDGYDGAAGYLNADAAVQSLTTFQSWFVKGYVDPAERGDEAFVQGKSAFSWVGHWQYTPYAARFGDDLVILPLPNFGRGAKTGLGSWQWGITRKAADVDASFSFLRFLLQPGQVIKMTEANGAVPATKSASTTSKKFAAGGAERLYVEQLQDANVAVARPQTPAYPGIQAAFNAALKEIAEGGDVRTALDRAVETVDFELSKYPAVRR
jgi:multiple sugar transport system substrate-binding protein